MKLNKTKIILGPTFLKNLNDNALPSECIQVLTGSITANNVTVIISNKI